MERVKKMVLIPQETIERMQLEQSSIGKSDHDFSASNNESAPEASSTLKTTKTVQTPGDNLSRLDGKMREILDSTNYTTENEKLKEFLQVLQRYLFFTGEKHKSTLNSNPIENSMQEQIILSSVPKIHQRKAKLLIDHLKANKSRINWNELGTVTIDGQKLRNSNIVDLINDAARSRKNVQAVGRKQFASILRETSTPREYIGNPDLWKLGDSFSHSRGEKSIASGISLNSDEDDDDEVELNNSTIVGNKSDSDLLANTVLYNKSSERGKKKHNTRTSTPIPKRNNKWLKF